MSLPRHAETYSQKGKAAKASAGKQFFAHARKFAYSRSSEDFEHVIAHCPLAGLGIALRFFLVHVSLESKNSLDLNTVRNNVKMVRF